MNKKFYANLLKILDGLQSEMDYLTEILRQGRNIVGQVEHVSDKIDMILKLTDLIPEDAPWWANMRIAEKIERLRLLAKGELSAYPDDGTATSYHRPIDLSFRVPHERESGEATAGYGGEPQG